MFLSVDGVVPLLCWLLYCIFRTLLLTNISLAIRQQPTGGVEAGQKFNVKAFDLESTAALPMNRWRDGKLFSTNMRVFLSFHIEWILSLRTMVHTFIRSL